jgi:hypothetical protein
MRTRSKTEVQAFRRCRQEHHLAYDLRRRPLVKSDALRIGSAYDAGQGVWWRTLDLRAACAAATAKAGDAFEAEKVCAMLRGYDARWRDEPYDVLAVQQVGVSPLPFEGEELVVVFDAVVRKHEDGRVALIESKSSSEDIEPGAWFWNRTRLDIQISHYLAAALRMGFDATECIYDVSRKPAIKPLKKVAEVKMTKGTKNEPPRPYANQQLEDETPAEYGARCLAEIIEAPQKFYQRATIVRLADEARAAAKDLHDTVSEMRDAAELGRHPRNPDQCQRFGSVCPYFAVCTGAARIDDDSLFQLSHQQENR